MNLEAIARIITDNIQILSAAFTVARWLPWSQLALTAALALITGWLLGATFSRTRRPGVPTRKLVFAPDRGGRIQVLAPDRDTHWDITARRLLAALSKRLETANESVSAASLLTALETCEDIDLILLLGDANLTNADLAALRTVAKARLKLIDAEHALVQA
jgi:hypothetical protein